MWPKWVSDLTNKHRIKHTKSDQSGADHQTEPKGALHFHLSSHDHLESVIAGHWFIVHVQKYNVDSVHSPSSSHSNSAAQQHFCCCVRGQRRPSRDSDSDSQLIRGHARWEELVSACLIRLFQCQLEIRPTSSILWLYLHSGGCTWRLYSPLCLKTAVLCTRRLQSSVPEVPEDYGPLYLKTVGSSVPEDCTVLCTGGLYGPLYLKTTVLCTRRLQG